MSVTVSLPTALGTATVQFTPNTDINPGWKDRPEMVDVYMELKSPFTVNRINFDSANVRFEVYANGGNIRQSGGLSTYVPGGFSSTVTSDKSRSKIIETLTNALQAFVNGPDFIKTVAEAQADGRKSMADRAQAKANELKKVIAELEALAARAMDPNESLAQVNKKYEDLTRYIR